MVDDTVDRSLTPGWDVALERIRRKARASHVRADNPQELLREVPPPHARKIVIYYPKPRLQGSLKLLCDAREGGEVIAQDSEVSRAVEEHNNSPFLVCLVER